MMAEKITIWTVGKASFMQMGGPMEHALVTDVQAEGPFDVGKGVSVYIALALNGDTFAIESTTGAIVGGTVEEVKCDVADDDDPQAKIKEATEWRKSRRDKRVSAEEFWRRMKCLSAGEPNG